MYNFKDLYLAQSDEKNLFENQLYSQVIHEMLFSD